MPTESNTGSDIGPNASKKNTQNSIKAYVHGQVHTLVPYETSREKMARVVRSVRKRRKKHGGR